ncbi:GNAT family N-acetyltransferase [Roseomonas sp. HF4]|uniref:GNAT family N-acetyltransferase n=1 Tax=Roseomonas sp. HF4 TaxID=2562313 RepID=UPI0010BF85FF|nr:GNAT family N-acetyltransferase [Roseomonas sp. HF4]
MTIRVDEVRTRRDESAFLDLPEQLHRGEAQWVTPLRLHERARWSPASNPSLRAREAVRFVAWSGSRPVGRIAAIRDTAFQLAWDPQAGFFGFFESIDEPACAAALFKAAEAWLAARGVRRVLGPINLSTHDEVGFLAEGFEQRASFLSPQNPRYFLPLAEAAGYRPIREYHAYRWSPQAPQTPLAQQFLRRAERPRPGLRLRQADRARWVHEARLIWSLYNACFSEVWGFVPITWDEFSERATAFRSFYRPDLIRIAELQGEPVGFALLLPDVNEALARLRGRLLPFGWLRLLLGVRRISTGRLLLLGVRPDCIGRGVSVALVADLMRIAARLSMEVEVSLVDAANAPAQSIQRVFQLPRSKVYRLYGKSLHGGDALSATEPLHPG